MHCRPVIVLGAIIAFGTVADNSHGQWVGFTEETGARLSLNAFADDPGGNPLLDSDEKDIAVGDLDRDGLTDVIVARKMPFSNPGARQDVLLMNEGGSLVDRTADFAPEFLTDWTDARDVLIADLDGDDWPDVVFANTFDEQPKYYANLGDDERGNWLGLADVTDERFPHINVANMAGPKFCAVTAGDVDGNGSPDIFFSNYNPNFFSTTDVLLINDGSGNFTDETAVRLGEYANVAFGTAAQIRDMDDDGDNDLIKISTLFAADPFDSRWIGIIWNDGTGHFTANEPQELPNSEPYMFDLGDLDGNGLLDMFQEGDNQDRSLLNISAVQDTQITVEEHLADPSPRTNGFGGNTKLADIDNDGDLDVGVAPIDVDIANCGGSEEFALLRNDGAGHFSDPWPNNDDQNFHDDPHDFAFIDLNDDGCLDVFMGLCTGWRVFIQTDCKAAGCPSDLDGDGATGTTDLLALLGAWGPNPGHPADLDGDGNVSTPDLLILLGAWGPCE